MAHEQRSRLAVERIVRIWVSEELGQEHFENVDHICREDPRQRVRSTLWEGCTRTEHRGPCLVNDIEADGATAVSQVSACRGEIIDIRRTVRRYSGGKSCS